MCLFTTDKKSNEIKVNILCKVKIGPGIKVLVVVVAFFQILQIHGNEACFRIC